jgi:hypothetical protein
MILLGLVELKLVPGIYVATTDFDIRYSNVSEI